VNDRTDDLSPHSATLEKMVEQELKGSKSYKEHLESGEALYISGRYEEAILPLTTAAEMHRNETFDLHCKSIGEKPYETKVKLYRSTVTVRAPPIYVNLAAEMEKKHFTTLMICVDSLLKVKRYEDARAELKRGVTIAGQIPEVWLILGFLQRILGNPDGAIQSFLEAVQQDITRRDLWENLLREYQIHSRPEARLVSEGLEKNRKPEENLILLAELYIAGGSYNKAQSVIDGILRQYQKNKQVLLPLSRLHIINEEYTKAEDVLEKFIKSDKNNLDGLWNLACVYAIQGKKKDSMKYLEKLLKLDQTHQEGLELQRKLTADMIVQTALLKENIMQQAIQTSSEGTPVEEISKQMQTIMTVLMQYVIPEIEERKLKN